MGRIAGPFSVRPLSNLIVSPIGLVPKAEPGKFRLIQHLSFPDGGSINDGINKSLCTVHYTNFDEAIKLVVSLGKGALMAKADIESAFRLLLIHPSDFELLGMKVNDLYYVDKALPMGASCSPALFEKFSTFIEWVTKNEANPNNCVHYMDDFLFVGLANDLDHLSCSRLVRIFENVCKRIGVPLAADKSVGPTSKIIFLGLEIDSVGQTVSIPTTKIQTVIGKVEEALKSSRLTLKELQSLIGSLSFVCKAIFPGRAFLRRLIDLTCGVKKPWFKISLSDGAKSDLRMWLVFLRDFNGISVIPDQFWCAGEDIQLFTDASGGVGFGGYLQGKWFQGKWPIAVKSNSIAWMEFFPILVVVTLWGNILKGKRIIFRSDNMSVISIINKQTSRSPKIMKLMRFFVL